MVEYIPDKLPSVSIILPTLGREEGLKKCLTSIDNLYYPKHLIETIVLPGEGTVPEKVARGLQQATGEILCYAANDMTFEPESMYKAATLCKSTRGLVAFNSGILTPDAGNRNEHFVVHRDMIGMIGGEIFDTRYYHVGVDNILWARCDKLGMARRCDDAIVRHNHFSTGKSEFDSVYSIGWNDERVAHDRALLKEDLAKLNESSSIM